MSDQEPGPFDIPSFLVRDANNRAEFMNMATQTTESAESRPAKSAKSPKLNGSNKPVKATAKVKAEAAPKAKAKAVKGPEKTKAAKPKSEAAKKDKYGLREGSARSTAASMYARKEGATLNEVKEAVGSVQLNVLGDLEKEGYTVAKKKEEREGERAVTRYFLKGKAK